MIKRKLTELTIPLKTWIQMFVARASDRTPTRLDGECELGQRFSLSRPTVHALLAELEEKGWLLHLPGRRGYYANPQKAFPGTRQFGMISGNADTRFGPSYLASICGAFKYEAGIFLHFVQLRTDSEEEFYQQIRNYDYSGVFWENPAAEFYPVVRRLIAEGLPLVISLIYGATELFPEGNVVLHGIPELAEKCGTIIRDKKYRHVVYYTECEHFFNCHRAKAPGSVRYEWLRNAADLESRYRNDPPDMILADGGDDRYREFFRAMERIAFPVPDLYFYNEGIPQITPACKQKLKGHLFPFPPAFYPSSLDLNNRHGKEALEKMDLLMRKHSHKEVKLEVHSRSAAKPKSKLHNH